MDLNKSVLATTLSGDQLIGEIPDHLEIFEQQFREGVSTLTSVRRFIVQKIEDRLPTGQVRIVMLFDIVPLEPLIGPSQQMKLKLSWYLLLKDYPELHRDITQLLERVEEKETQIRASRAGIQLARHGGPQS